MSCASAQSIVGAGAPAERSAIRTARDTLGRRVAPADRVTLVVLFLFYTNAAVVAVRFHGAPMIAAAGLLGTLLIPLGYYTLIRREPIIIDRVTMYVFAFVLVQACGAYAADLPHVAFETLTASIFEGLAVYLLFINVIRTPEMLRRALWTLLIAGATLGGLSLYQQLTRTFDNHYGGFAQMSNTSFDTGETRNARQIRQPRFAGPIGEQNRYAQIMLMLLPLGMFLTWGAGNRRRAALAGGATALTAVGMTLTFSRGAAVGLFAILVAMALLRCIRMRHVAALAVGMVVVLALVPQYGQRFHSMASLVDLTDSHAGGIRQADGSVRSRATEMLAAALAFADHPIIGVGPGMFRYHYREYSEQVGIRPKASDRKAHSLYLEIAAESGFVGLFCFMAITLTTLGGLVAARRRLIRRRPELANLATALFLSLVGYMVTAVFLHFAYVRYFWLALALGAAAVVIARRVDTESSSATFDPPTVAAH